MNSPPQVFSIDDIVPVIDPTAFVHPSAVLIGDVIIGPGCYIGPCASLRGDFGRLIVEAGANIQDTCVLHSFPDSDLVVEEDGHIGHGAVLHGCRIGRNALVGMNSVVMDNAVIGESAIIAACAFVKSGAQIPARTLAAGIPAKVVRDLSEQEIQWKSKGTRTYHELAQRCLMTMVATQPLSKVEPDRRRIRASDHRTLDAIKQEKL
jgi:phenylacetic acid degradation protein